jgi:hypothetical protein
MVHPTPRTFPSEASVVKRETLRIDCFPDVYISPFTLQTVASTGFVPIYSGGTARDLHPLPLPRSNVEGTLGDKEEGCQVH